MGYSAGIQSAGGAPAENDPHAADDCKQAGRQLSLHLPKLPGPELRIPPHSFSSSSVQDPESRNPEEVFLPCHKFLSVLGRNTKLTSSGGFLLLGLANCSLVIKSISNR